jgi:hypothetical protein
MISRSAFLAALALPLFSMNAHAVLLAGFNFNNATAGTSGALGTLNTSGTVEVYNTSTEIATPATHGAVASTATINLTGLGGTMGGTANNNWGTFAGDLTNAVSGDVTGQALSIVGNGNNLTSAVITVSTTGYEDVVLTYGTRGTASGYTTHTWEYSTNGTDYSPITAIIGRNVTTWSTQTVDLSSITAADDLATLWLRVTFDGATTTSGNNRIDNIQINAVPEPAAALLGSIGLIALLRRRRG